MKKLITSILLLIVTNAHCADAPQLTNLTSNDIKAVINDLASNLVPTNVSGASTLGKVFGFRIGVIAGATDTPAIARLTNNEVDQIPLAGVYAKIGVPLGFSFDLMLLPLDLGDFSYSYKSIGVQWTFSELLNLPVNLQLRANITSNEMQWTVVDSSTSSEVTYDHDSFALSLVASKSFLVFEPYFGLGYVSGENDFNATGTATVFDTSVTASQREGVTTSDLYYFLGLDVNLVFLQLGLEYGQQLDNSRIIGRLTFGY